MSWALSCLQLRKYYSELILITDDFGKELLIDRLNLPYTKVETNLNKLASYHPDLWALGKVFSYGSQNHPFIHVDSDVYIFKNFPSKIESSPLVCQNFDIDHVDYIRILKEMDNYKFDYPEVLSILRSNQQSVVASNAGILGGNNTEFFKEFKTTSFNFVNCNFSKLKDIHVASFNIIFEQYLFYAMAHYHNIPITPYFVKPDIGKTPNRCIMYHNTPTKSKYIHMIAGFKQNTLLVNQMKTLLRILHPEYYYKVINLSENAIFKI